VLFISVAGASKGFIVTLIFSDLFQNKIDSLLKTTIILITKTSKFPNKTKNLTTDLLKLKIIINKID
jgi:hypothetical protein